MNDFSNFLKLKNLELPEEYRTDHESRLCLRFLQGLKWDYQKSYDAMMEHAQWRTQTLDLNYENFKADLELGVIYGVRRDINMRPIIIVNVRRVVDTKITVERLLAVASFFLEYVIKHAMIPGNALRRLLLAEIQPVTASHSMPPG